jgi:hypothetical protein
VFSRWVATSAARTTLGRSSPYRRVVARTGRR